MGDSLSHLDDEITIMIRSKFFSVLVWAHFHPRDNAQMG